MLIPAPSVVLMIAGVAIWAHVIRYGPTCAYGDVESRRRFWIGVGLACFGAAVAVALWQAWG